MTQLYKPCDKCKGRGKIKAKSPPYIVKDTKKLLAIMKRNKLSQISLSKHLGISQASVSNWFKKKTYPVNGINPKYFIILKQKGLK